MRLLSGTALTFAMLAATAGSARAQFPPSCPPDGFAKAQQAILDACPCSAKQDPRAYRGCTGNAAQDCVDHKMITAACLKPLQKWVGSVACRPPFGGVVCCLQKFGKMRAYLKSDQGKCLAVKGACLSQSATLDNVACTNEKRVVGSDTCVNRTTAP